MVVARACLILACVFVLGTLGCGGDGAALADGGGATGASSGADGADGAGASDGAADSGGADTRSGPPPNYGERGYQAIACNFDMDDNGARGEEADCRVCDGVTADPDGDGVDEDIFYVDCGSGADTDSCGAPGEPCATIGHALNNRADGAGGGVEDIICFTGVCSPASLRSENAGVPAVKMQAPTGSEEREWELPRDPTMVVGWDRDGDGEYPPVDTDDESVLDGSGLDYAFDWSRSPASHFEFAHFAAREYGRASDELGGFIEVGPSHLYVHDIQLTNINREMETPSGRIVFGYFSSRDADWTYIRNVSCQDCGGYFTRGSAGDGPEEGGPFRFQNIYLSQHPCSFGSEGCSEQVTSTVQKFWGYMNGIEWIDNVFDGAPENRTIGDHPSEWPGGILFAQCSQNGLVRNNEFINIAGIAGVQGFADGFCDNDTARPVDGIVVADNVVRFDYPVDAEDGFAPSFFNVAVHGDGAGEHAGNVSFLRNEVLVDPGTMYRNCFAYQQHGVDVDATIRIEGNTCSGVQFKPYDQWSNSAAINVAGSSAMHRRFVVENNTVTGLTSAEQINVMVSEVAPQSWSAAGNNYDANGDYAWLGERVDTLAQWQMLSGSDDTSSE